MELAFNLADIPCTILTGLVADLHLNIGKIPVYSASPWIESLAHTVHDEYHNIVSIYYTNDSEVINIHYKVHSSKLALKELQRNK